MVSAADDKGKPRNGSDRNTSLRQRIRRGEVVFGPFMKLSCPPIVEIMGHAGFDFAIFDTEHGPITFESIEDLIRASEVAGISPLVRVYKNDPALISRALDLRAEGVIVPHVSSEEDAIRLTRASRYYPEGERGVCKYVRAADFSATDQHTYFSRANQDTLVVAIAEGSEGISNIDKILAVPGIDVVFVGPYDLSQSLGIPGQVDNPRVTQEIERIVDNARAAGIAVGTFVDNTAAAGRWLKAGIQFIAMSVDVGIVYQAAKGIVDSLAEIAKP